MPINSTLTAIALLLTCAGLTAQQAAPKAQSGAKASNSAKPSQPAPQKTKPVVAVVQPSCHGHVKPSFKQTARDAMSEYIEGEGYSVIDSAKLDRALAGSVVDGLPNERAVKAIRTSLGIDYVVALDFFNEGQYHNVTCWMIDTATGEIDEAHDFADKGTLLETLGVAERLADQLLDKVFRRKPADDGATTVATVAGGAETAMALVGAATGQLLGAAVDALPGAETAGAGLSEGAAVPGEPPTETSEAHPAADNASSTETPGSETAETVALDDAAPNAETADAVPSDGATAEEPQTETAHAEPSEGASAQEPQTVTAQDTSADNASETAEAPSADEAVTDQAEPSEGTATQEPPAETGDAHAAADGAASAEMPSADESATHAPKETVEPVEPKDAETLEAIAEARETVASLAPYFTFTKKDAPVSCTNIELVQYADQQRRAVVARNEEFAYALGARIIDGRLRGVSLFAYRGDDHRLSQDRLSVTVGRKMSSSALSPTKTVAPQASGGFGSEEAEMSDLAPLRLIASNPTAHAEVQVESKDGFFKRFELPEAARKAIARTIDMHDALELLRKEGADWQHGDK